MDRDDLDPVVDLLCRGRSDSPWERWAFVAEDRDDRMAAVFRAELRLIGLTCGEAWLVGSSIAPTAAAVWAFKDVSAMLSDGDRAVMRRIEVDGFGTRADAVWSRLQSLRAAVHADTAWELRLVVGDSPADLSAVVQPMLRRLDKAHAVASVIVSDRGMVGALAALGFEQYAVVPAATDGAPEMVLMARQPVFTATIPIDLDDM